MVIQLKTLDAERSSMSWETSEKQAGTFESACAFAGEEAIVEIEWEKGLARC